ncbi:hypothetical protein [Bartonella tribocorum]|uniref:hypothetical protein n=1 Tax=Bartonella tribocorum TaxID=85701 RepID=UPI0002D49EC1|nr:hypothetical protein [Bartonella tribocorum]CDO49669.1 hypothetical protein BM1374166_02026 [Bartonella tribocorum]
MIKIFSFFMGRGSAKNSQINAPINTPILEQPVANEVVRKSFRIGVLSFWLKFELTFVMEKVKAERHARSP